jgi:hypothetical protein
MTPMRQGQCIKTLDDGVFAEIRKLSGVKGAVPLCVGAACPPFVEAARTGRMIERAGAMIRSAEEWLRSLVP